MSKSIEKKEHRFSLEDLKSDDKNYLLEHPKYEIWERLFLIS